MIPPPGRSVGLTAGSSTGRLAITQGQAIEMTPVFRRQFGNKRRSPHGGKTIVRMQGSQATEVSIDKQPEAIRCNHQIMHIQVAGYMRGFWRIQAITALIQLTFLQNAEYC